MSEALYERYKDALRRGHVAALRGRFDDAIEAYTEASSIATERSLPYTSLGGIHLRLGRVDEALSAFGAALDRAPRDEAALLGRGEALSRAGRNAEAAEALDLVAEIQDAEGRRAEALATARRALEVAESTSRRQDVERLAGEVREKGPDRETELALAGAIRLPEPVEPEAEPAVEPAVAAVEPTVKPTGDVSPADATVLSIEADAALDAGEAGRARDALLAAARAHGAAGRFNAALDACYRALEVAPDDPELHLALVDLYLARGWRGLALEKLALLGRLVELDGDATAEEMVRSVAAASGADDPDLTGRPA